MKDLTKQLKTYLTSIFAYSVEYDQIVEWAGPTITAKSMADAQAMCNITGMGYCQVRGEIKIAPPYNEIFNLN